MGNRNRVGRAALVIVCVSLAGCTAVVDEGAPGDAGNSGKTAGNGGTAGSAGSRAGAAGRGGSSAGTGGSSGTSSTPPPSLGNCPVFPADNAWNIDVSNYPVHANSNNFINSIGRTTKLHPDFGTVWEGAPNGIPYVVVNAAEPRVPVNFVAYADESDPGPYPIPLNAPIEGGPSGGGDRHTLAIDSAACKLYELYVARPTGSAWQADSGAVWDLKSNQKRPLGWTSADAAGLAIFPGLARYDEVVDKGVIPHALRFTVSQSQAAMVAPATHYASSSTNANLPPMGLRVRLKSAFDCQSLSSEVQVICTALKRFGMIVADNGSSWYVSGAPDPRWKDDALADLGKITGDAFEVINTGAITTY